MKKIFAALMAVAIMAAMASATFGQECRRRAYYEPARSSRVYYDDSRVYYDNPQAYYDYSNRYRGRSFWDRHRDKLTLAAGTAGGAALGALIGGKRGAALGAATGLGGSAIYAYRIRNRRYRY